MAIVRHTGPRLSLSELPDRIVSSLGYNPHNPPDKIISDAITEAVSAVREKFNPRGIYKMFSVKSLDEDGIRLEHGTIQSAMFARLAGESAGEKYIVIWIATAGDDWMEELGPNE